MLAGIALTLLFVDRGKFEIKQITKSVTMPSYDLHYFNGRGRAELIRLVFAEAGVEFKDTRIEGKEWPKVKSNAPFGKLPVLFIDGNPLCQSLTIARYLAREFGLECKNNVSKAYADMITIALDELLFKLPFMVPESEKAKKLAEAMVTITENLEKFEKKCKEEDQSGGYVYLMENDLTYPDIALFNLFDNLEQFSKGSTDKFPSLKAKAKKVAARPNIKKYLEKRPKTNF